MKKFVSYNVCQCYKTFFYILPLLAFSNIYEHALSVLHPFWFLTYLQISDQAENTQKMKHSSLFILRIFDEKNVCYDVCQCYKTFFYILQHWAFSNIEEHATKVLHLFWFLTYLQILD